ncbi:MAG: hypothetical protein QOF89_6019 [Acidobacteriota bacterium]|jgi:hypothetical protein|nr:hypothetical protein [Acidobacteriota bacterium]
MTRDTRNTRDTSDVARHYKIAAWTAGGLSRALGSEGLGLELMYSVWL